MAKMDCGDRRCCRPVMVSAKAWASSTTRSVMDDWTKAKAQARMAAHVLTTDGVASRSVVAPARADQFAGPASKPTLSINSEACLRYLAMLASGRASGLSVPQLLTTSESATFGETGYSLLTLA